MERVRTTIYIKKENRDILSKYKINVSEFVNNAIESKFFGLSEKEARKQELLNEIDKLDREIVLLKENHEYMLNSLTVHEQRFVAQVKPRLREGKSETGLWQRFNAEFNRNFNLQEFQKIVTLYERQAESRAKHAFGEKHHDR